MGFCTELRLEAFFQPPPDSDGPSTIDLHVHWKHCLRVFRPTNHGILPPAEDEPVGPSCSSQFGFTFQLLSEIRQQIWTSIASLDFPVALSHFLSHQITSFVIDFVAESLTGLCPSLILVADINFVQRLYVDYVPQPPEFIQTDQLAVAMASAFADENSILGTTTEGPEVDSNGDGTFILALGVTMEGWGGAEGDSDIFFDENFILGTPAEVDDNAGIEMLERTKRGNWVMGGGEEVTCSVCLEDFSEGQEVMTLTCKHTYHEQCLLTWLDRNQTCPLCRRLI